MKGNCDVRPTNSVTKAIKINHANKMTLKFERALECEKQIILEAERRR